VVYSLTSASALGLDLARTPGGVGAAGVLLRGLLAPPVGPVPGPRPPAGLDAARAHALRLLGPDGPTVVDLTAPDPGGGGPGGSGPEGAPEDLAVTLRRMLRRLGAVSFGTVADLVDLAGRLPRTAPGPGDPGVLAVEGLSLHPAAAAALERGQVLADGVLAGLVLGRDDPAAPVLARALEHRLRSTPHALLPTLPPAGAALLLHDDPSSVTLGTVALLRRIAGVAEVSRLQAGHGAAAHVWAEHMHEASWAVETTGRTRDAAAAQLDLLRCLSVAGVSAEQSLTGVWNLCSAAVQAQVVADVFGPDSWTVLTAELLDVLPPKLL